MSLFLNRLPPRAPAMPRAAMILAAGRGERMMPLTETTPKPLLPINGQCALDLALERILEAGIESVVVNAAYLGQMIADHVQAVGDPRIKISHEDEPLETGGGVVKARPLLGDDPFYVINGDTVWFDGMKCPLVRLAEGWDPERMDILLLLASTARSSGYGGLGDFTMDQNGRLLRREEGIVAPYAYMGLSIINPAILDGAPEGRFSLNWAYDRAIERERLFGLLHDGLWYHISTPADLDFARSRVANGHAPAVPFF